MTKKPLTPAQVPCPCGSGQTRSACCDRYGVGNGAVAAPTAAALMRSRYSAYVRQDESYLLATWHDSTRPARLDLVPTQWLGLHVKRHEVQDPDHATVEFVARFKINGRAHSLSESSRFVREAGRWFYLDGECS